LLVSPDDILVGEAADEKSEALFPMSTLSPFRSRAPFVTVRTILAAMALVGSRADEFWETVRWPVESRERI
jgi:hypothetical protein